jgi:hypothetical protein
MHPFPNLQSVAGSDDQFHTSTTSPEFTTIRSGTTPDRRLWSGFPFEDYSG